jgi:hypothetical protein
MPSGEEVIEPASQAFVLRLNLYLSEEGEINDLIGVGELLSNINAGSVGGAHIQAGRPTGHGVKTGTTLPLLWKMLRKYSIHER